MNVITAHKESFDRKVIVVTKESTVQKKEWINENGEIPIGAKIVDTRKGRFGNKQVLCVWETVEPAEWETFGSKADAMRFVNAESNR